MTEETAGTAPGGAVAPTQEGEAHAFQAEMQQLLHIIIHSLYSEREIFLRELISNASDALNKLRFHQLTRPDVRNPEQELEITLEVDADAKTLTIGDTGIAMTREELQANLGTIARSGTLEFVKELSQAEPGQRRELIGQFGVGFYSVFMVAKEVVVDSCPADPAQEAWQWRSDGSGQFYLSPSTRTRRGTSIRLVLKDDAGDFYNPGRLEDIVKRYSSFIPYPIRLDSRRLNTQEAIWTQGPGQVEEKEYQEFYRFLTHGLDDPLHQMHVSIDAPVQYQALLFMPEHLTNEVLYSQTGFGLQLYANRVFIQDDCQQLLPLYLRFLRGVVDTEDLPLNVSREVVQKNPLLARLRTSLTGRVLRELKALSESNPERYTKFWGQYGKILKEGLNSDPGNRERLLELARFNSSVCEKQEDLTTLSEYVGRMREGQKEILFISGPSRDAIERNPHLEFFRKKGLEVLYLYDQVDDFVMTQLGEFEGKTIAGIERADLEAFKNDDGPAVTEGEALGEADLNAVLAHFKKTLGERVSDVTASKRLVASPACLVSPDGLTVNLERMMRAMDQGFKRAPKILEINPTHPLVRDLARLIADAPEDDLVQAVTEQVFENCMLVEGLVEQPARMVDRIQQLMESAARLRVAATEPSEG